MTLHEFIRILRHRWIVLVACTVVAAAVMWLVTPSSADVTKKIGSYTATATLLVGTKAAPAPAPATGRGATAQPAQPQQQGANISYGRIELYVRSGEIPARAAEVLGYNGNPALLASGLTVLSDPNSASVSISATASDGDRAAEVANTFADEAVAFFNEDRPETGNTALSVWQQATPIPNDPGGGFVVPPNRGLRTGLAALVGLLLGLGLALLLDRLDSRLRTRSEVHKALRMPVIAEVPRLPLGKSAKDQIEFLREPLGVYADGYRAARSAIVHLPSQQLVGEWTTGAGADGAVTATPPSAARVVLVTSAHAQEGKTTSVANLAASFAEAGQRVLVVDADLRSPDAHNMFDVPQGTGVSDFVSKAAGTSIASLIRPTNVPNVSILTAGTRLDYPASLASRMGPLLAQAREAADIVLVDTAPLLAASDVFDILPMVDTIVLVARSGRITEGAAQRTAELLGRFQVPVVGVILVGAPMGRADGYAGAYGYGYGKDKKSKQEREEAEDTAASAPVPAAATVAAAAAAVPVAAAAPVTTPAPPVWSTPVEPAQSSLAADLLGPRTTPEPSLEAPVAVEPDSTQILQAVQFTAQDGPTGTPRRAD